MKVVVDIIIEDAEALRKLLYELEGLKGKCRVYEVTVTCFNALTVYKGK